MILKSHFCQAERSRGNHGKRGLERFYRIKCYYQISIKLLSARAKSRANANPRPMYHVYILKCSDGTLYTGMTNDIEKRFHAHQLGIAGSVYTLRRLPVALLFTADFQYVNEAIAAEKQLKRWSKQKKLALIRGDISALKVLAACRNETHYRNW